jgi:hypothetical protein
MLLGAFTVASVLETALVSLQAWRGVPSHFVLQAFAWLLSFTNWSEERKLRLVAIGAAGYIALAVVTGVANFTGLSLASPPIATIALLAALPVLATGWLAISAAAQANHSPYLPHGIAALRRPPRSAPSQ